MSSGSGSNLPIGTLHLAEQLTTSGCLPDQMVPIPAPAVRVELSPNCRLTFVASDGYTLASYERASLTARIALPSATIIARSSVAGSVIVANNTCHALRVNACPLFQGALGNAKIHPRVGWLPCLKAFTIHTFAPSARTFAIAFENEAVPNDWRTVTNDGTSKSTSSTAHARSAASRRNCSRPELANRRCEHRGRGATQINSSGGTVRCRPHRAVVNREGRP